MDALPQPDFTVLHEREDLFVVKSVHMPDDEELFLVLHQLRDILPKQRERRIGDNDVSLLEQVDAFLAAKIAVGFESARLDLREVRKALLLLLAAVLEVDAMRRLVLAE